MTASRPQYLYPDSLDHIDPGFDLRAERPSLGRVRGHTDVFAHELLGPTAYDGLLLSCAMVRSPRFSQAMRQRLLREGVHAFYRLPSSSLVIGDSGAYASPAGTLPNVAETASLYDHLHVSIGLAPDMLVPGLALLPGARRPTGRRLRRADERFEARDATLNAARHFLKQHAERRARWVPAGVAQGWDVPSYVDAVALLERIGYDFIALGGLAAARADDILTVLRAVGAARRPTTRFHLLGVAQADVLREAPSLGIVSFDSSMPMRQAFKDHRNNYHRLHAPALTALRLPQTEASIRVRQGPAVSFATASNAEREAIRLLWAYNDGEAPLDVVLAAVNRFATLLGLNPRLHEAEYALQSRAWEMCPCPMCRTSGVAVLLFRTSEHNKRRGIHNLWAFAQLRAHLHQAMGLPPAST